MKKIKRFSFILVALFSLATFSCGPKPVPTNPDVPEQPDNPEKPDTPEQEICVVLAMLKKSINTTAKS